MEALPLISNGDSSFLSVSGDLSENNNNLPPGAIQGHN